MNKEMLMKLSPHALVPMLLHKQDFIKISKKVANQQQKANAFDLSIVIMAKIFGNFFYINFK